MIRIRPVSQLAAAACCILLSGALPIAAAPAAAPYASVAPDASAVRAACDASDLGAAARLVGKAASFRGEVARVFVASSGRFAAIDFDRNYEKAVVAVATGDSVKRFSSLGALTGRDVLVTGKVDRFHGRPEVVVDSPAQIKIIARPIRSAARAI